jgi:hypothetical protein
MIIAITYLYPILFSFLFGYYNGWQWTDEQDGVYDPRKAKKRWKGASLALRTLAMSAPVLFFYFPADFSHYIIALSISLPLFDTTINLTRGMPIFYLGTTSRSDLIGKRKWLIYLIIISLSVILKFIL